MAFIDNPLLLSNAQAISASAASTNIYDVTGAGSGNAPGVTFGTGNPIFVDIGAGDGVVRPVASFTVTTTGTGTGTIAIAVEAAPDNGSNAPGTYQILTETQPFTGTALVAGEQINLGIPPAPILQNGTQLLPRFYRFYYTVSGTATVSLSGAIQLNPTTGLTSLQIGNNFTSV